MQPLRLRGRWTPWPLGIYCLGFALVMGGIGIYSALYFPQEKPSVRLAIPMYALSVYWVLALLCNRRSATVSALGVRVVVWPFFVWPVRRAKRSDLRHCYVRCINVVDEGTLLESYYSVGVETLGGDQIDVSKPHTESEARQLAREVASALNQAAGPPPLTVADVEQIPRKIGRTLLVAGAWLALFIASIFLGLAWELGQP